MYDYEICTVPDEDVFYKQCAALEKRLPAVVKERLMRDVDSSLVQTYKMNEKSITVINDSMLGVIIRSEVDIDPYFSRD